MMMQGYIKLYRRTLNSQVFQNEGLFKVWIWCLLRANHKETWVSIRTGKGFTEVLLKPGKFIFGRESAAKKLLMKPTTVWKRLKKLENIGNLDIQSNRQYSIITIVNWDTYQGTEIKSDSQRRSWFIQTAQALTSTPYNERLIISLFLSKAFCELVCSAFSN